MSKTNTAIPAQGTVVPEGQPLAGLVESSDQPGVYRSVRSVSIFAISTEPTPAVPQRVPAELDDKNGTPR